MASGTVVNSLPASFQANSGFIRWGPLGGITLQSWTDINDLGTIPSGYRPKVMAGFIAPLRSGAGATPVYKEIRFNNDGSITIPSGETQFYGTFLWPINT